MTIDNRVTSLGRVRIIGQYHRKASDQALWELEGYTPRLPLKGALGSGTPGSHALRVLHLRAVPRYLKYVQPVRFARFFDPLLLDLLLAPADKDGQALQMHVLGLTASVTLADACRVLLSPFWEHPDYRDSEPDEQQNNVVPSYRLEGASIPLAATSASALRDLLPGLDDKDLVELTPGGILYTANVRLDGTNIVRTRVRLELRQGQPRIVFLAQQSEDSRAAWLRQWQRLDQIAAASCDTAWLRLGFQLDGQLPALEWSAKRNGTLIEVNWQNVELPSGLVQLTLADQPLESRILPPRQVLRLTRGMHLTLTPSTLTLATPKSATPAGDTARYVWDGEKESLDFDDLGLVHDPLALRERLDAAYARQTPADAPLSGFIPLRDGWLQVPIDALPGLPEAIPPGDSADAQGSFWLGTRRSEFVSEDAVPSVAPWSVQLDEPADCVVELAFKQAAAPGGKATLTKASVTLGRFAMSVRGLLWLAATRPDEHDGLPQVSDVPGAFFDVLLRKCAPGSPRVPLTLGALKLRAPTRVGDDWNAMSRQALQPRLEDTLTLTLNPDFTAPAAARKRLWLRHPSLPCVQLMALTRSDPRSTRPHASRALLPFDSTAPLQLLAPQDLAARLSDKTLAGCKPASSDLAGAAFPVASLAALSLPGLELHPVSVQDYRATGHYTLPLWDESHARAVLPLPDGSVPPPASVVTALDDAAQARAWRDDQRLRQAAATLDSKMFQAPAVGKAVSLEDFHPGHPVDAKAEYDATIVSGGGDLRMGSVRFVGKALDAELSGDALLEGPKGGPLPGWSLPEQQSGAWIEDGRGVSWSEVADRGELRLRSLVTRGKTLTQVSTAQPLKVTGLDGTAWWLAFSDLPMSEGRLLAEDADTGLAWRVRQHWSWSLFEHDPQRPAGIAPLALGAGLRFLPVALAGVQLTTAQLGIEQVTVEGTLVLGADNPVLAADSVRRVRIALQRKAGTDGLVIAGIGAARITWDLDLQADGGLFDGAPQLSGDLRVANGRLVLDNARLQVRVLGQDCVVAYPGGKSLDIGVPKAEFEVTVTAKQYQAQVSKATLDLSKGRLSDLQLRIDLREGLYCLLDAGPGSATLNWFGNALNMQAQLNAGRGVCVLTRASEDSDPVTVFPGHAPARFIAGAVCLSIAAGRNGGLELRSGVVELLFSVAELQITHLLHRAQDSASDTLRLDGNWQRTSLIGWPNLEAVKLDAGLDSQVIDFKTPPQIAHVAQFLFCEHLLDASGFVQASAGKGLRPGGGKGPVARWLVESTHLLDAGKTSVEVRGLTTLEFWHPGALAERLESTWSVQLVEPGKTARSAGFVFVPGYMGRNTPTADFIRPGVRRADQGHAGLLSPTVVAALRQMPEDQCILLAGSTLLCAAPEARESLLLHLPFLGVLDDVPAPALVRVLGTVGNGTKLEMVRHDIQPQRVRLDEEQVIPAGGLVRVVPQRDLPFARNLLANTTTSGASLAASWFGAQGANVLDNWHVEQLQRPGATPASGAPSALPFAYPRAALMLAALLREGRRSWQAVSVLVRTPVRQRSLDVPSQAMDVDVSLVRLQASLATGQDLPSGRRSDLLAGSASAVVAVPLSASDLAVGDDKHLLGLALARLAEPLFVVQREVEAWHVSYRCLELPAADRDPLAFAVRPLRDGNAKGPDGHLTWPQGLKAVDSLLSALPREARTCPAPLALAGVRGQLQARQASGVPLALAEAGQVEEHTVWLQEWNDVAFAETAEPRTGAAPWPRERLGTRPLLPAATAIAAALVRLDPNLTAERSPVVQTWLPAAAASLDFAGRAGAFVGIGARILRGIGSATGDLIPAQGGPASQRTLRRPRPLALAENLGEPHGWRRPLAWYGLPGRTCLSFVGAWDMIPGPLSATTPDIPRHCLFVGNPRAHGLLPGAAGQPPTWRGALEVQCVVYEGERILANPGFWLLGLLRTAQADGSLRCGLRQGSRRIDFAWIEALPLKKDVASDRLLFAPAGGEQIEGGDWVFECSFVPTPGGPSREPVSLGKREGAPTLAPAALRSLVLPVWVPQQAVYPLPLQRRTIFFADPAFDARLSRIDPLSVPGPKNAQPPFKAWIDRPSTTADESVVLRVRTSASDDYQLIALLSPREGGSAVRLRFELGGEPLDSVALAPNRFFTLPIAALRSAAGQAAQAGDTLVLEFRSAPKEDPARLYVPLKARSSLPAPEAMYSLIATDPGSQQSWCSAHSSNPAPESLLTEVIDADSDRLVRRALFKWVAFEPSTRSGLAWSILRAERATQSLHVPQSLEPEQQPAAVEGQ